MKAFLSTLDWKYLYAAVAFAVGTLSGFQAIYNRYPTEPLSSAATVPGGIYLLTRGGMPAIIFAVMYYQKTLSAYPFLSSLFIGAASEVVLRSQILIKQTAKQGGGIDELVKGPLDLLKWYQDLFLVAIETKRAAKRQEFVKKHMPTGDFRTLATRVLDNKEAFRDGKSELEQAVNKLMKDFETDANEASVKNERYRQKLGYLVLRAVGQSNFKTLFAES